ncbi:fatty acyl-AMP ligase [Mycobacterium shimoidei]|uniref:Acyl-CoA synthetase (AMP-forming)/AMP-acid ligase II [Cylindrospermum stagnale PCC 7417] n=1 Tax=Mycobacterium shimoidei TaxID=29313 RepID=A0A1E3TIT0_MYCSH|nr:fatty acyl-AMP ligase [Mycobacterium shimoidei]MCV7257797.1 fatty acyl-AMP ligase [Mycobacterium shimoidei]ODR14240.1 fatty-acid--CoA ligase [Mycobacterium shimoidei]ORW83863.1 fatty-acid--CoA ligase [Mycobacterium shimoidei]SRX91946.1 acyl-CoA synthetase (AMP-forming)/AMP-acid ligase II [Cylindrospermum stagnale PCC 7417] [Mycobacterium shimoidei]
MSEVSGRTAHTLVDLLRQQAARHTDKVAFRFAPDGTDEQDSLTYGDLDRRARAIAAGLQQNGATGRRVLVVCRPGLSSVAAYFGCLYAGAVAVPVQDRLARLTAIAPDARAGFALADAATQDKLKASVDQLAKRPLRWLTPDEPDADPDAWVPPDVDADTTATLQYTSGSTRAPKGVVLTHGNLLANLVAIHEAWGGDEHAVTVYWLPQHHDMGLIGGILEMVYVGCTTVLMSPAAFITRPMRWLEAMSRYRATGTTAPNFAYQLCVERSTAKERAALDLSQWSTAMNGAEPVQASTLRDFAEAFAPAGFRPEAFLPVYGLAEATLLVSGGSESAAPRVCHIDRTALGEDRVVEIPDATGDDARTVELVGCGAPRGGQQIVIVDPETRRRRGVDEVGEIWVSGPCVARGYRGKPEDTEQTFGGYLADTGEGPFLRTGDLGFLRAGEVFITGRCKDLIIIRGNNYYPNDIEKTVQGCHSMLLAGRGAAFSVAPRQGAGEQLVVVQEVHRQRAGENTEFAGVLETIQAAIVRHHGIRAYAVVLVEAGSIPTTSSGKIQRQATKQRFVDGQFAALAEWQAPPGSDTGAAEPAAAARTAAAVQQAVALQYWKSQRR